MHKDLVIVAKNLKQTCFTRESVKDRVNRGKKKKEREEEGGRMRVRQRKRRGKGGLER